MTATKDTVIMNIDVKMVSVEYDTISWRGRQKYSVLNKVFLFGFDENDAVLFLISKVKMSDGLWEYYRYSDGYVYVCFHKFKSNSSPVKENR